MVVSGLSVVDIGNEDTLVGNTSKNLNLKIGLFADSFGYEHQEDPGAIPIEETLSILDGFQKAGKIRHIAVSNETPWGVMKYLEHSNNGVGPRPTIIQNAYSLINRLFEVKI